MTKRTISSLTNQSQKIQDRIDEMDYHDECQDMLWNETKEGQLHRHHMDLLEQAKEAIDNAIENLQSYYDKEPVPEETYKPTYEELDRIRTKYGSNHG